MFEAVLHSNWQVTVPAPICLAVRIYVCTLLMNTDKHETLNVLLNC